MFKNYWTIAWRSLIRNKIYSVFNVLGLAFGICACLVIYLVTRFEFSFDSFQQDKDRIYCVDAGMPGKTGDHSHWNDVPRPMPAAMRREMSGFEAVAAFELINDDVEIPKGPNGIPLKLDDAGKMAIAEPQYFDIFHYHWLGGNPATALSQPYSVVLTASKAKEYFGDLPPDQVMGKVFYYEDSMMVTVTGVVADWAGNSDFNFSQWVSYSTIRASFWKSAIPLDNWGELRHSSQVMVKLAKGVSPTQINAQFVQFAKRHLTPQPGFAVVLKPLTGIHFHQEYGGEQRKASLPVLYTLMSVAAFILILAFINFVNLSTAQSMKRAKEVGIRKVLGGRKGGIALQFFTETALLTTAAAALALLMVRPVLHIFADFIPAGVQFKLLDGATLLFLFVIMAITTLATGIYPAKVLAAYLPTLTLKGKTVAEGGEKGTLRKSLIVFQFTISLLFIIASIIIGSQLRYMLRSDFGFRTEAVVNLRPLWGDRTGKMAVLANEVRGINGVDRVIRQMIPPMGRAHTSTMAGLMASNQKPVEVNIYAGNEDYVPFYGLKLIAGRNLIHSDSIREVLINETFAHDLGFSDVNKAIGKMVAQDGKPYPVAGVVADFYENSFRERIMPVIIEHDPGLENDLAIRTASKNMAAVEFKALMGKVEKDWKALYPDEPFSFSFLDESIANLYASDIQTEWLTNVAMGIMIFISCLGLLGLAIFFTERRTKEIGIRKVLGATVPNIVVMLCKDIILLIVIALLIASPLAWYFMHDWLQGFAYRTAVSGWMFVAAGTAAIGIALLTVGFQAMKAAMANPSDALRTE